MMTLRRANDRGSVDIGWLRSEHTFSFGEYYDRAHMGFGPLRVINEDRVLPGRGFDPHGHQNMEIISYVIDGALAHRDSLGNGSTIRPGDVQRMSAGTGVRHSEYNASDSQDVHFLQIWIEPEQTDVAPGYEQTHFSRDDKLGKFRLIASPGGRDGSVTIHQQVDLYAAVLESGMAVRHQLGENRQGWLHVAQGEAVVNGTTLSAGDAAALGTAGAIHVTAPDSSEVLLFDLRHTE